MVISTTNKLHCLFYELLILTSKSNMEKSIKDRQMCKCKNVFNIHSIICAEKSAHFNMMTYLAVIDSLKKLLVYAVGFHYVHLEKYQLTAAKQSALFMTHSHIPAQEEQEAFYHCKTSKHEQVVIASNGISRVNMYWPVDGHLGSLSVIALWSPTTKDMQIQENQNYTITVYCILHCRTGNTRSHIINCYH